ncbi:MAG: proline--tRNA ligase [Dehalococcoidia bacterium]|nr:proline--tRNA ligase [Dehalococcoidia bacterium]
MLVSRMLEKTLRDDPAEAEIVSHRLMLRAGIINQVAAGVYSYLPLAWRSLRKIEQIIREEMDDAGGQELRMPALQPQDLWDRSGRTEVMGKNMFKFQDRRERDLVIAPTHEEVVTNIIKANVHSYRDLPRILYQIQTKFRDEERPRAGLLRVREFDMKDAYSFDADEEGLDLSYQAMVRAYTNIYERCGLDSIMVEADSGAIGGKDSHEFMALAEAGEDTILMCQDDCCSYAANEEKAVFVKPEQPVEGHLPLEDVHTPGIRTIEELAKDQGIPASKTLKAVFYWADGEVVFVVIRGDLDVNEIKLLNTLKANELRLATAEEVEGAGLVAGSASPIGLDGIRVIADDSVLLGSNFLVGANREDYHVRNANYGRDFTADTITDIALAKAGDQCAKCEAPMGERRGIEVGHVFKLGTKYSEALDAHFPAQNEKQMPIIMGCYGIGVGRLLAACIEQNHDDKGIVFPPSVAPYDVWITALNYDDRDVSTEALRLHDELRASGLDVLLDDRNESAGVKFNDADLIGLPVRLVVSRRNMKQDVVELKLRNSSEPETVARDQVAARVAQLLGQR